MHHQIDSLAYTNRLRYLPPEHKLGFAIALFLLGYLAPTFVKLLIAVWLWVWVVVYARIPAQIYGKLLVLPISFLLLSLPALLIGIGALNHLPNFAADVLYGVPVGSLYVYLSSQGCVQAGMVLGRAITLTSCMYFILLTVPFVEILRILRQVGCPELLSELLLLMYRFIFVIAETATELLAAQQTRFGYGNWRSQMRSLSLLVGHLLRRTLANYRELSLGLASRGYGSELRVWHTARHRPSWRYAIEAIGGYLFLLILTGLHYWTALC